ncbi:MAG: hypothetical protein UT34_C0002G0337 [candidate division WS6 bacterium GW2011_GWF2_39_15]|uniref:Uncharacterized protein n=1 Tax=candidate division WS6 bacterium GW2011_GWF2_39_15 TaxID=1619100 RepID=A0A0G0Q5Y8_9BACT|nr:MAG: hypothetical protein UT34_C0002G0337 [candidate division WS6 bacterium GW2011_GWF2_39_15]
MKNKVSSDKWWLAWGQYIAVILLAIVLGYIVDFYYPTSNMWLGASVIVFASICGISAVTRITGLSIPYFYPIKVGKAEFKGYDMTRKGFNGYWKDILLALLFSLLVYFIEKIWIK